MNNMQLYIIILKIIVMFDNTVMLIECYENSDNFHGELEKIKNYINNLIEKKKEVDITKKKCNSDPFYEFVTKYVDKTKKNIKNNFISNLNKYNFQVISISGWDGYIDDSEKRVKYECDIECTYMNNHKLNLSYMHGNLWNDSYYYYGDKYTYCKIIAPEFIEYMYMYEPSKNAVYTIIGPDDEWYLGGELTRAEYNLDDNNIYSKLKYYDKYDWKNKDKTIKNIKIADEMLEIVEKIRSDVHNFMSQISDINNMKKTKNIIQTNESTNM